MKRSSEHVKKTWAMKKTSGFELFVIELKTNYDT